MRHQDHQRHKPCTQRPPESSTLLQLSGFIWFSPAQSSSALARYAVQQSTTSLTHSPWPADFAITVHNTNKKKLYNGVQRARKTARCDWLVTTLNVLVCKKNNPLYGIDRVTDRTTGRQRYSIKENMWPWLTLNGQNSPYVTWHKVTTTTTTITFSAFKKTFLFNVADGHHGHFI